MVIKVYKEEMFCYTDDSIDQQKIGCGHYKSLEEVCASIALTKVLYKPKFFKFNLDEAASHAYFKTVKARYERFLFYVLSKRNRKNRIKTMKKFAPIENSIRHILRREWNPIGFDKNLPEDEYDSYIPRILELLDEDASVNMVESLLEHIETTVIGLKRPKSYELKLRFKANDVANKLCALKQK